MHPTPPNLWRNRKVPPCTTQVGKNLLIEVLPIHGVLMALPSWSQANLHFGHQQFFLITDMVLPTLTLSLFPLFLNYQILYFPLLQFLTCLGICWFCKIPLTLLLRIRSSWHHSFHRITYVKYLGYCGGQKFWRHLHVS